MTYYNWSREHICDHCGEPFRTMGGNLTTCAPCRHSPKAEAARKERQKRLRTLRDRRKASVHRREAANATSGPGTPGNIAVQHDGDGMFREGEAA